MPGADQIVVDYMHNPDVFIMTLLMDEYQPHSCNGWGIAANENVPVIVRGGTSMGFGGSGGFESLFYNVGGIPKRVFIDHELRVHSIHSGYMTDAEIKFKINEMLELKEESQ